MSNRRVLIVLEEGAKACMLACDHAMDEVDFLATQVIEIYAGENSTFDFYELEETHTNTVRLSNMYVDQKANRRTPLHHNRSSQKDMEGAYMLRNAAGGPSGNYFSSFFRYCLKFGFLSLRTPLHCNRPRHKDLEGAYIRRYAAGGPSCNYFSSFSW